MGRSLAGWSWLLMAACAPRVVLPPVVIVAPSPSVPAAALAAPAPDAPVKPVPVAIEASQPVDVATLFHQAHEAAQAGNTAEAIASYTFLLQSYAADPLWPQAAYNRGLLYEAVHDLPAAVGDYRHIIAAAPHDTSEHTWLDAHFRLGVCETKLGHTWPAVTAFDAVLSQEDLADDDRLDALVGRGIAMQEGGADFEAETALLDALHFVDQRRREGLFDDHGLAAEAAFRLGELANRQFLAVTLAFPNELLRSRLEQKCALLLDAQNRYLRAMRYGDHQTVAAAGLRIGGLYEALHDALVTLPVPNELTPAEAEVYQGEVRQRVGILLKKALVIYEKALLAGKRGSGAEVWTTRLEAALSRLRTLYLADNSFGRRVNDERGLTPGGQSVQ